MYRIEEFDGRNITFATSLALARIRVSSLAEDIVQRTVLTDDQRIDTRALPSIAQFEQLAQKTRIMRDEVYQSARRCHIMMLLDPRLKTFALVNPTSNDIIGVAEWALPSYTQPAFKVTILRKLYAGWLRLWYGFLGLFSKGYSIEPILREYHEAAEKQGLHVPNLEETINELKRKTRAELENTVYPDEMSYYLRVFGIRPDCHGGGLGKQLLQGSFERLRAAGIVKPPMLDGPAKFQWQSAPEARKFYEKQGCTAGPTCITQNKLEHTAFYLNVD